MTRALSLVLVSAVALMVTATACGRGGSSSQPVRLTPAQLTQCARRGKPLTLARLVRVFRANGISLTITESTCFASEKERRAGALVDATNGGPAGVDISTSVMREQGHVLCRVFLNAAATNRVYVSKYSTDVETHVETLNVDCVVYPFEASEKRQVMRLRRATVALVARVKNGR